MIRKNAEKTIIRIGKALSDKGFVVANDGNLSIRLPYDRILITPTGVRKGEMTEKDLLLVDLEGNVLEGGLQPTSEIRMHLALYKHSPEIGAVCHAHPVFSTAFAVAGRALDVPLTCESVMNLGSVPLCPFAMPGTDDVPKSVEPFIDGNCAVLLANHGVLTWGTDLDQAFDRMESVEMLAKIMYLFGYLDKPNLLTKEAVEGLLSR